ncbi:protein of unknown function [Ruminococcaceae bacterium BL-6]|nr:protein of unknown function [Ruminococcaceae bacterium BL-6]
MKKLIPKMINGKKYNIVEGTGEVVDFNEPFYAESEIERQQKIDAVKKKQNREFQLLRINDQYKDYGSFIWAIYSMSKRNYDKLKPSNLARLMFISTYLNYNGFLEIKNNVPMTKNDLKGLMKLSNGEFYNFINELSVHKILYTKKDKLFINPNLFIKGKLKSELVGEIYANQQVITRIYINAVRKLYNRATPCSHKTLSYIFQVMPFVNRQYNIVCFNPLEENPDKIRAMSFGEFCDAIGYNRDHSRRLYNVMFKPKFMVGKEEKCAIKYFSGEDSKLLNNHIIVNPRVYYAGNIWWKVEWIGKF